MNLNEKLTTVKDYPRRFDGWQDAPHTQTGVIYTFGIIAGSLIIAPGIPRAVWLLAVVAFGVVIVRACRTNWTNVIAHAWRMAAIADEARLDALAVVSEQAETIRAWQNAYALLELDNIKLRNALNTQAAADAYVGATERIEEVA